MRPSDFLARCTLALALAVAPVALGGCEDENDPKTWVNKLSNESKRTGAVYRLRQLFDSTMATTRPPQNPRDPAVRRYLDTALPRIVDVFVAHPDDTVARREAIEILAQSEDPRAIPALTAALTFRPGVGDTERIAKRAAEALKAMAALIPEGQKPAVTNALLGAIDRATGNSINARQIRYTAIQALGAMRATAAVETLSRILTRPLAEQEISNARAAADALGEIGDPRGVDALIYGLFLNIQRQNAFPHCMRGLARIGVQQAAPRVIATLNGQNAQVEGLITQYANIPNAEPVPPGHVKTVSCNVLGALASDTAVDPLLALLSDRAAPENTRAAAGEALSYIAVSYPTQRARILQALTTVFRENQPSNDHTWSATFIAPRLALIGDRTSVPLLREAVHHRFIADAPHAAARVDLLLPYATIARRADVADVQAMIDGARTQIQSQISAAPEDERADAQRQAQPYLTALDRITAVNSVARDCNDGDIACYTGKLGDANHDVVRKAAYMIAWTATDQNREQARDALLARINHPEVLVRRSIMVGIDALSPAGCAACITRFNQLIESERTQESKILSHLDAMLLMARLRARSAT